MRQRKPIENRKMTLTVDGQEMEVLEIATSNAVKELKADLRSAFGKHYHGLRFSVKVVMMGHKPALELSWTDGPQYQEVEKVAQKFVGRRVDGSSIICQNLFMHNNKHFVYRVGVISLHHSFSDPDREREVIKAVYQQ